MARWHQAGLMPLFDSVFLMESQKGENPELCTLFFRCSRLMSMPLLPLFAFGQAWKVSGNAHWLTTGMKNIIAAYGFEWRTAPGEAEAELAYLNRIGIIDGVLSDDVDNFLFGTTMVIRNSSNALSGNRAHPVKNTDGRGCILIGLLSGGDYHQAGVQGCGKLIAAALARSVSSLSREELEKWLVTWRNDVREELRTNKYPDDFPDVDILLSYTNPIMSETEGKPTREITWEKEPDIGKIAGLCELYFEWGVKDVIIKRFRTVLWPSAVQRILRAVRKGLPMSPQKSKTTGKLAPGTPSKMITKYFSDTESEAEKDRLIVKIHSSRRHASTDGILEYRLEIAPAQLVRLAEDVDVALDDTEGEDEGEDCGKQKGKGKKLPPDPESHLRIWMPASMVETVELQLVEAFGDV
ncbi:PIN domain-like protein [Suillus ampliporus]|nr:PIN domain-like protein [Suillus ampliporus]